MQIFDVRVPIPDMPGRENRMLVAAEDAPVAIAKVCEIFCEFMGRKIEAYPLGEVVIVEELKPVFRSVL